MLKNSSTKQKPKTSERDLLKDIFSDFRKISEENIPLQQKVDKLNLEMLRILKVKAN